MTFTEMYSLGQTILDKSGSPYLPESEFDQLANIAYNDWIEKEYRLLEQNHEHTSRLRVLYKTFTKPNANTIDLPNEVPDYRYLIRFRSKYNLVCNGKTTVKYPVIRKMQNDDIDVSENDPFNKGVDADPTYIQTADPALNTPILQVFSDTVPLELAMTYVRTPQVIDSASQGGVVFEMPDYIAQEIVMLAIKKAEVVIENYNRMKGEMNEIQQRLA